MAVQFELVGKLSVGKDSDKFKSYEEKTYDSGWTNKTFKFNVISGDNRFMMQSKGGYFADGHGEIFVFGKDRVDANGKVTKGEAFRIPWKERTTHPRLSEVVEWKKYTVDLETGSFRRELQSALNKVKDGGELTEAEISKFGASDVKGLEAALEKSNKKRKEFIAEADFVDFMKKVATSETYKNKTFRIRGTYDLQYSEANNKFYGNYVPQRVYLVDDETEDMAEATATLFYDSEALVDATEEKGKYFVNAYVQTYDSARKGNIFAPYVIAIDANDNEKKVKKLVEIFTVEDGVKELGVVVTLLDGAQRSAIKLEDLDEETQENILFGLTTLEEVARELGGSTYGERITENRFSKLGRGYAKGRQDTAYESEDLIVKPLEKADTNVFAATDSDNEDTSLEDDDFDLFN